MHTMEQYHFQAVSARRSGTTLYCKVFLKNTSSSDHIGLSEELRSSSQEIVVQKRFCKIPKKCQWLSSSSENLQKSTLLKTDPAL